MAQLQVSCKLSLNSLLCFCISKFSKLPLNRIKGIVLDYFSSDDVAIAKRQLMSDIEAIIKPSDTALPRYPARQGETRVRRRKLMTFFDILTVLDERLILSRLPSYVTDSSDKMPSVKLDDGDLCFMLAKLDKMEALINNLQSTLQSLQCLELLCSINYTVFIVGDFNLPDVSSHLQEVIQILVSYYVRLCM